MPDHLVWVFPPEDPSWHQEIIREFRIHPVTAQLLISRGFTTFEKIHRFLYSQLPDLLDPSLFLDMESAVERICQAVQKREGILIFGDNDVDGMTGTALLVEFLKGLGGNVLFFIPPSSSQRTQLFSQGVRYAQEHGCTLFITVDCGITAVEEIAEMRRSGIDVLVTDHHEPPETIPPALATLNPKLVNQTYPNRDLTGVGVAFKLIHGITNAVSDEKRIDLKLFLDLVALGTIADMGALVGENRILVRYGLKQLQKTERVGLQKLFQICGVERGELTMLDIGAKIAPRMNSLGRVADPKKGVEMLLVRDPEEGERLAKELDLSNIERQKADQLVTKDVEKRLAAHPELLAHRALVLHSSKWHPGVIPIVSARIAKMYNRPTVLIAVTDGFGKGSLRTIKEFPLLSALRACSDLLLNYGGHDMAAGMTIPEENLERFRERFLALAQEQLRDQDLISKLYLDAKASFSDLTYDLLASLELLEPYGNENGPPVLYTEVKQAWVPKVVGGAHLKLYLEQGERVLEGIAFGMAERREELTASRHLPLQIAFTPQWNRFHGKGNLQLHVRDVTILT